MYLSNECLLELLDYIDSQMTFRPCKGDLSITIDFLRKIGCRDIEGTVSWLKEYGGYCDCEVLANMDIEEL